MLHLADLKPEAAVAASGCFSLSWSRAPSPQPLLFRCVTRVAAFAEEEAAAAAATTAAEDRCSGNGRYPKQFVLKLRRAHNLQILPAFRSNKLDRHDQ